MFKKGFTLSEVIVTLGILGVLAAILGPMLMKITPDNNRVMFKKAHSVLQQAVQEVINNAANYPIDELGTTTDTSASVSRGFNFTDTTGTVVPASTNKFCFLLADAMNTIGTVTCPATSGTATFSTSDGISWTIIIPASQFPLNATSYTTRVVFDVNGTAKPPNCGGAATTNITTVCPSNTTADLYEVGIRYDGKIDVISTDGEAILSDPTRNTK